MAETELVIGIGCQRGTPASVLAHGIDSALDAQQRARVRALATIDRKRAEAGLLTLARERGWPIEFYSAAQLGQGVAEPAALRYAQQSTLLIGKLIFRDPAGSMTIAVAEIAR